MKARHVSLAQVQGIIEKLNREKYAGNIVIEKIKEESSTTISFKLGTADKCEYGSRKSRSGRHGKWACTHVFEDVMTGVVALGGYVPIAKGFPGNNSGRTLRVETEREVSAWADMYNQSNVGSMMQPSYPDDLCVGCYQNF